MKAKGFTVIELLFIIVVLGVASWLYFSEKSTIRATEHDTIRKSTVNAMYYDLENVFYAAHGYYPTTIDAATLPAVDPSLFTDPDGNKINTSSSEYHYIAEGCGTDNHCKSYTLRAQLEREGDYTKTSKHS